jgi:hypothetical protein
VDRLGGIVLVAFFVSVLGAVVTVSVLQGQAIGREYRAGERP